MHDFSTYTLNLLLQQRARADPDTDVPHLFGLKVGTHRTKTIELVDMDGGSSRSSMSEDQYAPPKKKRKPDDSFDWMQLLKTPGFEAATVSQIKHVIDKSYVFEHEVLSWSRFLISTISKGSTISPVGKC